MNSKMSETKENKTWNKLRIGSRLSSQLYFCFVKHLKDDNKSMPSKELLVSEMSQTMNTTAKKNNNTIRKKFRNWTKRMVYSNGDLIHKITKRVIIPEKDYFNAIKEIHECNGSSGEHLSISQTVRQIKSRFTWSSKNFGMDLMDVLEALIDCQKPKCRQSAEVIRDKLNSIALHKGIAINDQKIDESVDHKCIDGNGSDDNCDTIQLKAHIPRSDVFNELIFKISSMKTEINLLKVNKFGRNSTLKENIVKCERLVHHLRSSLHITRPKL